MYNKKEKLLNWFNIFFTLFQVINISLFIYLCLGWYYEENQATLGQTAYVYPWILMAVIGFLGIKSVLQLGNALIFNSGGVIGEVVFKKISYLNFSAVIAFLANILLCYVFKNSTVIVYGAGLLILLINALGWWAVLKNHQKFLVDNFLYFILYLCALEIAPLIIIGSYLND